MGHPLVQAVLTHFPDAALESIRDLTETTPAEAGLDGGEESGAGDPDDDEEADER